MRKALQRAAQALVAAGALGAVYPAVAQVALPAAKPASATPARASAQGGTHEAEAGAAQSKLEEIEVELALLANPSTFAYPLGAKHTGENVELHGFVPSKYVQQQAMETARKHCSVPVVDKLQVNDAMMLRTPGGSAEALQQAAWALLAEGCGHVTALDIKSAAGGRVTLSGVCESYEQKLEIGKKLRGLSGCCAVDNNLVVKPTLRDGQMVMLVTADGFCTLSDAEDRGGPQHTPPHPGHKATDNAYAWLEPPPVPPPAQVSTKMDAYPPAHKTELATTVAMKNDLPPVPPADAEWNKGDPVRPIVPPAKPATPPAVPIPAPIAPTAAVSASPLSHVPAYAPAPVNAGDPVKAPAPVEHIPAPPAPVKPVTPPSTGWPTAHDAHLGQVAYATTGVILFDDDSIPEPPPLLGKDQATTLRQKVQAVCGAKAKYVFVETKPDGLHVHVQCAAMTEDEALTRQIYALPEMASQNAKLHFELGK